MIISELFLYNSYFEELLQLVYILGRHSNFFSLLLFSDKEMVSRLIMSNDPDLRKSISTAISSNSDKIIEILKSTDQIEDYVQVIFYLLYDPEPEIGLKIQTFLYKISKKYPEFYQLPSVGKLLQAGMDEQNELMFRVADVVIETSNQSPPHQIPLLPFLEKIVKMYDSEDILTSLNAVQAMIHMADSCFNSDFLLKHDVF